MRNELRKVFNVIWDKFDKFIVAKIYLNFFMSLFICFSIIHNFIAAQSLKLLNHSQFSLNILLNRSTKSYYPRFRFATLFYRRFLMQFPFLFSTIFYSFKSFPISSLKSTNSHSCTLGISYLSYLVPLWKKIFTASPRAMFIFILTRIFFFW